MRLKDKVAVITGAAAGIGLACAKRFAVEGAKVVLADLDEKRGERAAKEIRDEGGAALFVACDVGDKQQVDRLIERAVEEYGRLDCAIANAGIVVAEDFLEFSEDDFDKVIRVNLKGVFLTDQAAARQMVRQGRGEDGSAGTIINMSSINAEVAIPTITPYVVAKGGVRQLTKVAALALIGHGIRVNAIGPGSIRTEVFEKVAANPEAIRKMLMRTPIGRVGEPDEMAKIAVFLASDDSSYVVGETIYADGGRLPLNGVVPVPDDA